MGKTDVSAVQMVLELGRRTGVLHAREVRALGIPATYLARLCAEALLQRTGRGLYVLPDAEVTALHSLAEAAKAVPDGIVCLLSALSFHGIGTQAPFEVWMALARGRATPRTPWPKMRFVHISGALFTAGVGEHVIEGVPVKVYSPAKTVADCFRFRNRIGMDVAQEALREALRSRKCSVDELWDFARICRVTKTLRPYAESFLER